ncbi:MAG: hypothetical protein ABSD58_08630 [Verrucomicrobiia bacterium]
MWKTLGTPVSESASGTEHECNLILEQYRRHRQPSLMFFFKKVDSSTLQPGEDENYRKVKQFQESISAQVLWKSYSDREDLLRQIKQALREKIEAKISIQYERDRAWGEYPPNRTLTVEILMSARFDDGRQVPFILVLRNGRGEQIAIDTRFQHIHWIAQSMGYAASEGVLISDIISANAAHALSTGAEKFELLAGSLVVEPHPQCKIEKMWISAFKPLKSEDGTPNVRVRGGHLEIKHFRPYLTRNEDGSWNLVG